MLTKPESRRTALAVFSFIRCKPPGSTQHLEDGKSASPGRNTGRKMMA